MEVGLYNYGLGGHLNGGNYLFSLEQNGTVFFLWDEGTKILTIEILRPIFIPIILR